MNNKWATLFKQKDAYETKTILQLLAMFNFNKNFEIIHVVGTNGKGSVATIIHHNLVKNGFKVGLFTSPHLTNPCERIKVNDKIITDQEFWKICDSLPVKINFFATFYVVAMIYFMQQNCQIVILEAGIGGKLDATSVIKGRYGLITNVAYDHTDLLGHSLKKIASQKYGIKNHQMRFYVGLTINKRIISRFNEPNTFFVANFADDYVSQNFLLAQIFLNIEFKLQTIDQITLKGRSDFFINNNQITVFDVGHNESGIDMTLKLLKQKNICIKDIVIMLKNTKKISKLPQLFKQYQVYYYQKNHYFHNFSMFNWNKVNNLHDFFNKQKFATLYIGSFELIGELYDYQK